MGSLRITLDTGSEESVKIKKEVVFQVSFLGTYHLTWQDSLVGHKKALLKAGTAYWFEWRKPE